MRTHIDHRVMLGRGIRQLLLLLLTTCSFSLSHAQSRADQVKAVFLYNFTQFVDFPQNSFDNNNFVIGILGRDPFGDYIDSVVKDERVNGMPIIVKRFREVSDVRNCNVLYVNMANPQTALRTLRKKSILTVGSSENFARDGGVIGFTIQNDKIRLQINLRAAKEAQLSISSKLLRVSDVIQK